MRFFPKVVVVAELPQWITSSDRAAYHPASRTIYLRRGEVRQLWHELGHWLADVFGSPRLHTWIDKREAKP